MQGRYIDSIKYQQIVERVSKTINDEYKYVHVGTNPLLNVLESIILEMNKCNWCKSYAVEKRKRIFVNLFEDITTMITNAHIRYRFEQYTEDFIIYPLYDLMICKNRPHRRRSCCF